MTDESRQYGEFLSRRRFVELAGVSGAAALAGCGGDGDGGESAGTDAADGTETEGGSDDDAATETATEDDEPMRVHDVTYRGMTNLVPADVQFNMLNGSNRPQIAQYNLFDRFAQFNYARGQLQPYAISDWAFTGETFEMQVREGLTWENGDPVTAEDVATQLRLGKIANTSMWEYTERVDVDDERTVVLTLSRDVNPAIVEFDVLEDRLVHQKADVFGRFLETYESGDEQAAQRRLQEFDYRDVVASGPWSLEEADREEFRMSRRESHPDAENINFGEYVFRRYDGNQEVHRALIDGEIDSAWSVFTPPDTLDQLPDAVEHVTFPGKWGTGLVPNHDHEHAGDRAVRQAIQYVIDRREVIRTVGEELKVAPEVPVGIPSADQDRWLDDAMSDFNTYGVGESMHEEAAAVLEASGYRKVDGTWEDAEGNPVELPVTVPSGWTDFVTMTETMVDQLDEFGFRASVDARDFGTVSGSIWPNGNFVLASASWLPGGGRAAFPYFSLKHQLNEHNSGLRFNYAPASQGAGGSNADVTVPAMDGNGDVTVNPTDRLDELSRSLDVETTLEITRELAWVTNVDLPMIPVVEKLQQSFVGGEGWETTDPDAEVTKAMWPPVWLPRQGELRYAGD